jgi:hypothetical protein
MAFLIEASVQFVPDHLIEALDSQWPISTSMGDLAAEAAAVELVHSGALPPVEEALRQDSGELSGRSGI